MHSDQKLETQNIIQFVNFCVLQFDIDEYNSNTVALILMEKGSQNLE